MPIFITEYPDRSEGPQIEADSFDDADAKAPDGVRVLGELLEVIFVDLRKESAGMRLVA